MLLKHQCSFPVPLIFHAMPFLSTSFIEMIFSLENILWLMSQPPFYPLKNTHYTVCNVVAAATHLSIAFGNFLETP